jgi:hypothetical protein
MKVIENKYLPLPGFKAMNLFGLILFVRKGAKMSSEDMNHEEIHSAQWRELLYIGFLLWYVLEWLVRLIQYRNFDKAYRNISFEREAYANDDNLTYLETRRRFAFVKYLK